MQIVHFRKCCHATLQPNMHALSPIADISCSVKIFTLTEKKQRTLSELYIYPNRCTKGCRQREYSYRTSFAGKGETIDWGIRVNIDTIFKRTTFVQYGRV